MYRKGNLFFRESEVEDFDSVKSLLTMPNPEYETVKRHATKFAVLPEKELLFYTENPLTYSVPRNFPLHYFNSRPTDKTTYGNGYTSDLTFHGVLRDYQDQYLEPIDLFTETDFVGNIPTGHGKTVMAMYIIGQRKVRTLILVGTLFLANQWVEKIDKHLPGASYMIAKPAVKQNWLEPDILIMSFDLFAGRELPDEFYECWGQVILDEAHETGAPTYQPFLKRLNARYRLALTATFRRSDGMHQILAYDFGKVFTMQNQHVSVRVMPFYTDVEVDIKNFYSRGKLSYSLMDSWICQHEDRNEKLLELVRYCLDNGRRVMFLSKRKEWLKKFHEQFKDDYVSELVVAETNSPELHKRIHKAQVIWGIAQLAKTGLDAPQLDTYIPHCPSSDVEQGFGRINREYEGKQTPLALMPFDTISVYMAMYKKSMSILTDVKILPYTKFSNIFAAIHAVK